ncbi:MAG: VOC family protein [Solirubrobacterales bacterium]
MAAEKNPSSPLASMKGHHVGLRVPDLDAALTWYSEKLDFRLTASTEAAGLTWAFLAPADDDSFLIELAAGPGAVDRPEWGELTDMLDLHGWHHVCLWVDDLDHTIAELISRDVAVVAGPLDYEELGQRAAFVADPWGNLFELLEDLDETQGALAGA